MCGEVPRCIQLIDLQVVTGECVESEFKECALTNEEDAIQALMDEIESLQTLSAVPKVRHEFLQLSH